jgi:hypothetical protein
MGVTVVYITKDIKLTSLKTRFSVLFLIYILLIAIIVCTSRTIPRIIIITLFSTIIILIGVKCFMLKTNKTNKSTRQKQIGQKQDRFHVDTEFNKYIVSINMIVIVLFSLYQVYCAFTGTPIISLIPFGRWSGITILYTDDPLIFKFNLFVHFICIIICVYILYSYFPFKRKK